MKELIIVGSAGHAKVVIDIFEKMGTYKILGLVDSFRKIGEQTAGYQILGGLEIIPECLNNNAKIELFIAVGDNWNRKKIYTEIIAFNPEAKFANAIHPSVQLAKTVTLGIGIALMGGAIVNSNSKLEDFTVINTKASLDHDCVLKEFASIGPGVTVGGYVIIEQFAAISIGTTVRDRVSIGQHTVVGAGSLVMKSFEENLIVYGSPAQEIRKREVGEKYV